jgi:hypothetical protein
MADMQHRNATRQDIRGIVDFQIAMAQETEGIVLDRHVCTLGVEAVFQDPNRGPTSLRSPLPIWSPRSSSPPSGATGGTDSSGGSRAQGLRAPA